MQFEKLPLQRRDIIRPVALLAGLHRGGSLVVWTMQHCNGRQAVMSALEALVLAGKGLIAFSVLFLNNLFFKRFQNSKLIMQSGPCESNKYLLLYFQCLFSNRN
jgi:hypothetical protein